MYLFDASILAPWLKYLIVNALRYFIICGVFFLIFYVLFKQKWKRRRVQIRMPQNKDYQREIIYSLLTLFVFSLHAIAVFNPVVLPYTKVYFNISDYGWGYLILSFFLMILIHDTYFYWMHRAIHHPKWYRTFHLIHHKSTNPSPWAAYAFHPLEAVLESLVTSIIVFSMPAHPLALMVFFLFMLTYNAYGHLGYEIMPKGFSKHWLGKWFSTSVSHNMHHEHVTGNYGLYFLFWDRMMGTLREDYDERFEKTGTPKDIDSAIK